MAPDFTINVGYVAADASGANTGRYIFIAPAPCTVLEVTETHATAAAAADSIRLKKVLAGVAEAAGAATDDEDHIDLTEETLVDTTADTPQDIPLVDDPSAANLATGDRLAIASAAGIATLAGGLITIRMAWL
jgi:hypothetical protein